MTTRKADADRGTILYLSHGGGPLPLLGDASHKAMVDFMVGLRPRLPRPDAILVISAHWEERLATVLGAPNPPLLYDYYGFPEEAYRVTYPAPGAPDLADRVVRLLGEAQIEARIDIERGFDHGHFVPLKMMYPEADIPSTQLSLVRGLDPVVHLEMGKALRGLMQQNFLVMGSGFSFHNMREFSWGTDVEPDRANDLFQDWLVSTCTDPMPWAEREGRLSHWQDAPAARYCHPREEHLLPLHVCAGLASEFGPARKVFDDSILGKRAVAFQW